MEAAFFALHVLNVTGYAGVMLYDITDYKRLDPVGTAIAVQQKLMRHSDIRTTLNVYGDVVTDEMEQAHAKVVGLTLGKAN